MSRVLDVHWLSEDQQQIWRAYLLGSTKINHYLDEDLRTFNIDLGAYEILVALSDSETWSLRMSTLAKKVHQSRSRLTHSVSRLEHSGYVVRGKAGEDGRGVVAQLTNEGFALLEKAAPSHVAAVRRILVDAVSSDDFAALGRAMDAVLKVED